MPTFCDYAFASRDLRVLPSFAPALPRLTPKPEESDERHEVVVVGAGPAGLFLTLLLARYGLSDFSLLCIDGKPGTLKSGQADGLQPRTLEVLASLGLAHEVLTEGCQMWEVGFWNAPASGKGIERTTYAPDVAVPSRFPHEITIHQGRVERILADDLARYSARGVQFSTKLVCLKMDEEGDAEYPVLLEVERNSIGENGQETREQYTIRTKHVVGADGAHSAVRNAVGLSLEGESQDHIWGVVDLVVDTEFPDIRRRCAIHSAAGSVMIIPRERISTGEYLTRLYVQLAEEETPDQGPEKDTGMNDASNLKTKEELRKRRAKITLESILDQARKVFAPYDLELQKGREVDWWAAYQIGQRMSNRFSVPDSKGIPRVFIAGDACHTHSPKAGQGMNVSMMDSYNLSWKLAYHLNGLTPLKESIAADGKIVFSLLDTYETERREIARQLIEFDTKFSSMFSGKMGIAKGEDFAENLTHEQFLEVFSQGSGFTSGCGIEYPLSDLVQKTISANGSDGSSEDSTRLLRGILHPGRRFINANVIRHADGNPRALQDDFISTGQFRILLLASTDLMDKNGRSSKALETAGDIMERFPQGLLELTVVHPLEAPSIRGCAWADLPSTVKKYAEMRFHCGIKSVPVGKESSCVSGDDAYAIFGVVRNVGAACVVRPDGYVGVVTGLDDIVKLRHYLDCLLVRA